LSMAARHEITKKYVRISFDSFDSLYNEFMASPLARLTPEDLAASDAARLRGGLDRATTVTVGEVTVEVSDHTRAVLTDILDRLAAGDEVDVTPVPGMLTTQESADLLRVSRPTLVKMLEDGLLPHERPGVHRRVPRVAVENFLASRRQRRKTALEALAETHDPEGPDEVVRTR